MFTKKELWFLALVCFPGAVGLLAVYWHAYRRERLERQQSELHASFRRASRQSGDIDKTDRSVQ